MPPAEGDEKLIEYRLGELERQFLTANDKVEKTLAAQGDRLERVHAKLIELEAKLQQPGFSSSCQAHQAAVVAVTARIESIDNRLRTVDESRLLRIEGRLGSVEVRSWAIAGGFAVLASLLTIFGPALRHALSLP